MDPGWLLLSGWDDQVEKLQQSLLAYVENIYYLVLYQRKLLTAMVNHWSAITERTGEGK